MLPTVGIALRTLGLKRVQEILGGQAKTAAEPAGASTEAQARQVARLVEAAARVVGGTCLVRSLVLARQLRRRGIAAQVKIGVRKLEKGFEAHAWVETAGVVLNDGPDVARRYAAFDRNFALARVNWR